MRQTSTLSQESAVPQRPPSADQLPLKYPSPALWRNGSRSVFASVPTDSAAKLPVLEWWSVDDPGGEHDQYDGEDREHYVADQVEDHGVAARPTANGSMRECPPGVGQECACR